MINDLKELEKFFKICRKQGVSDISIDNIVVKFGDIPNKSATQSDEADEIETETLTQEQMMFYAVQNAGPV